MLLPSIFAMVMGLALIIGDWFQFTTLKPWACRYGCPLARRKDLLPKPKESFPQLFKTNSTIPLPHGVARWVPDSQTIVIRPYYKMFSLRFRTAWPLKGTLDYHFQDDHLQLHLSKRIPWSSAILTSLWLLFVIGGTLSFVGMYAIDGGFGTVGGVFWAVGMIALGLLVLAGGVILLAFAYRLEDSRLMQVYEELTAAIEAKGKPEVLTDQ
jgi:hypothetical protein